VGYFVEVLWGLEKRIWDASEEKTMRCGAVRSPGRKRESRDTRKGFDRDKRRMR
jgi:hypothetical protein